MKLLIAEATIRTKGLELVKKKECALDLASLRIVITANPMSEMLCEIVQQLYIDFARIPHTPISVMLQNNDDASENCIGELANLLFWSVLQ